MPILRSPHQKCGDCPIRHRAVCSYCDASELAKLDSIKFYRDFETGQEIVGEGEVTEFLGSIVTGVVALQKSLEDGRRQIVGLLFASDFIGRALRPIAPYDAIAVTPVRMCLFNRRQFEKVLLENTSLERRLLEMTLDELDGAREWMLLLGRKSALEKVASMLMILARRSAGLEKTPLMDGISFTIPMTREAMAEYLGLTIETVSRQMTALRKQGIIDLIDKRLVNVIHLDALRLAAGEDPDPDEFPQTARSA
ncbi:helix-turn-helix domain-containing protein [Rhodobacteraceae bacterium NNCM2]|nr:helix-turn-helix domain-containing protein [Coraliihabitans acroporae]